MTLTSHTKLLSINKTWDYKGDGGLLQTKNHSSVRKVQINRQTVIQFSELIKVPKYEPIFVENRIYNSTINDLLKRRCKAINIPIITIHDFRHTHASLLLFAGVPIASVARMLGHASLIFPDRPVKVLPSSPNFRCFQE